MYFRCYAQYPSRCFDHSILTDSLGIELLKLRRERFGLTFLFKILHNSIGSPFILSEINIRVPSPGLRRNNTFYFTYSRSNVMSRSPINCILYSYQQRNGMSGYFPELLLSTYDLVINIILILVVSFVY
ncbi:hypothetical protein WA026_009169 [Henosepilachna vigintioctopunctata]|uniref:Uncharacterized protein n=1 Tax=Henosepilachna vigintioctopunctata TaxID=420089 RepID=A0AAW1UWR0_9CUCU